MSAGTNREWSWQSVAAVAVLLALAMRAATFLCALQLWTPPAPLSAVALPELTYLIFMLIALPAGALLLASHPPTLRHPVRTAATLLVIVAAAALLYQWLFFEVMVRWAGFGRQHARAILTAGFSRTFHTLASVVLLLACVVWVLLSDEARPARLRRRADLERELARRAAAAVRRHVHPRLVARALSDLWYAIECGGDGEVILHRIARHLRLLRRRDGERVSLAVEMRLLASLDRLTGSRFDVELPDALRDVAIHTGLAAACADAIAATHAPHGPIRVAVAAVEGGTTVVLAAGDGDRGFVSAVHQRLADDDGLAAAASVGRTACGIAITFRDAVAEPLPARPLPPPTALGRVAYLVPLLVVTFIVTRVAISAAGFETFTVPRVLTAVLWIAPAPFLVRYVRRLRGPFLGVLLRALAWSGLVAAAVCAAAVELSERMTGHEVAFDADSATWLTLPRDSVTIGVAIAVSALLLTHALLRREEQTRAVRLEALLSRADAGAVASRFHPHFLFNALNALLALLREDRFAAAGMSRRLAALFCDIVDAPLLQEWPFSDERRLVERYLEIMRIRFGERLRLVWNVAPELEDVPVPRLILQPLAENAIYHGLARRSAPTTVAVTIAAAGRRAIRLSVENDTAGGVTLPPAPGGGLRFTADRLALLYGADSLPRYSAGAQTFRVDITLPFAEPLRLTASSPPKSDRAGCGSGG